MATARDAEGRPSDSGLPAKLAAHPSVQARARAAQGR